MKIRLMNISESVRRIEYEKERVDIIENKVKYKINNKKNNFGIKL